MVRSTLSRAALASVLAGFIACQPCAEEQGASAELATPTAAGEVGGARDLFDPAQWAVRKALSINLGGQLTDARAVLLRSVNPKGESLGAPLFAVDMLIVSGGKAAYQFHQAGAPFEFFMDDTLEAKDVTDDGIPEVLFHSGSVGASDYNTYEHVIYHAPDQGSAAMAAPITGSEWLVDVGAYAALPFIHSRRQTFRWIDFRGGTLALMARPVIPASGDDLRACHLCPKYYEYLAFKWRKDRQSFVLLRSIQSLRDFGDETDPLQNDLSFIIGRLSKECQ
jgi:hypothetical protein